ncbi:acyl-CoA thioesterase [Tunicatimonas pelagia]|uniref:acyl-CoA thioesterase n=1 Tax=Tunicatimonas pelagia TaxID=931531 RepID=UPI002666E013|nr:thioesterase family protein [Tunicatimonas pelagia]WKN40841.1 thioesterase family protein [Tunicatimonas pelagia]
MISLDDINKYRFRYVIQVRYSDMDMLGHANNAVYLTYLEAARIAYFREVNRTGSEEIALVLAHADMNFKIPLTPDIHPVVRMRTTRLGNSSMTIDNIITDEEEERLFFTASTVMVAIDPKTGRPVPIPVDEKQKVIDYEPALD